MLKHEMIFKKKGFLLKHEVFFYNTTTKGLPIERYVDLTY